MELEVLNAQGAALRLFTAVACAIHTCFTALYGAVNQRRGETKLTTMAQDERSAWKSINRRPFPWSGQQPILIGQDTRASYSLYDTESHKSVRVVQPSESPSSSRRFGALWPEVRS